MSAYDEHVAHLSEPEAFDASLFQPDSRYSAPLCDFVLSLAVAYNDLRDLLLGWILMAEIATDDNRPTRQAGQAGGLAAHLLKTTTGFIHELLVLVDASREARADPMFANIVRKIHRDSRKAWEAIVTIQKGSKVPIHLRGMCTGHAIRLRFTTTSMRFGMDTNWRLPIRP